MSKLFKYVMGAFAAFVLIFGVLPLIYVFFIMELTPEEQAAQDAKLAAHAQAEETRKQNSKLIWDCRRSIQARLHNPDSYEHISGVVAKDKIVITFRARNQYNALVQQQLYCDR